LLGGSIQLAEFLQRPFVEPINPAHASFPRRNRSGRDF
jgi:hypothetical protein